MRQIKFRVWDNEDRQMTYLDGQALDWSHEGFKLVFGLNFHSDYWQGSSDNYELMQFTGLQDRTGKDVYEGDIVEMFERSLFRVVWNDYYARYQLELVKGNELTKVHVPDQFQFSVIVGNIYEHKDLLKGERK